MCGIVGFNWEDKDLIKRMSTILEHRGPDGFGYFTDKGISLGHRRLSIIDLSAAGKNPMTNEDETVQLIFNGEIYNFKELRSQLEKKGHRFSSHTDTEVILHGYEEWGENVVHKLNGEFAFALWDTNKKRLFLARDRLGIKPLYYYWNNGKLIFASEIKSILLEPSVPRKVNKTAAYHFLNRRYIPGEDTLFDGIKKLLPGHTLTLGNGKVVIKQFWDVPLPETKNGVGVIKETEELLRDSVGRRLIADVPVGVYLSGGIDSASIVALASQAKKEKGETDAVKTFSVGFNADSEVDELHKARIIANHFNTDHHEIVVEGNISKLLPKIIWHLDQPHGDPVVIPMFKLSELASKKVKVVLSGEGADEVFGGYVQYKTMLQAQKMKFIPSTLGKNVAQHLPVSVFDQLYDYPSSIGEKGKEKVLDFIEDLKQEGVAYQDLITITSKKDREELFTQKIVPQTESYFQPQRKPLLNRMLYYDTKTWLPNYVLYINDRMTMAHSIEGRVPFLDHRLVEYVSKLDAKWKINGVNKYLLRKAMAKTLPASVNNTKKHAFFMPLDKWYKDELKELAQELFTPSSVKNRGYFNYDQMQKIWNNYDSSKLIYGKQLFTMINFELWQRQFIDAEKIPLNNKTTISSLL
ncbi:asparagine synthase (glutamine-hydrolyzing) [Candidatus Woesearchaeota archaeon]|nr:asparagine synthase (glutamine-hydrolyzing) [Candidatus Woesearchaeota archaeon]